MDARRERQAVELRLSHDEAVALDTLLQRWQREGLPETLKFEDQAERRVLGDLTASLKPVVRAVDAPLVACFIRVDVTVDDPVIDDTFERVSERLQDLLQEAVLDEPNGLELQSMTALTLGPVPPGGAIEESDLGGFELWKPLGVLAEEDANDDG